MYLDDTIRTEKGQGESAEKSVRDLLQVVRDKRSASLQAAVYFKRLAVETRLLSEDAALYVQHCGDTLTMLEDDSGEHKRLKSAYFCGQRLCPGCAYRGSLASAVILSAITGAMLAEGYTPLLVTVTAPNCTGDDLGAEILRYNQAWNKLMHRVQYKTAWASHVRKFEITYNAQMDTYHPHIHALVFVRPGYFGGRKDRANKVGGYISQEQLLADWRRAYGDKNITQVDIRKCYGQDWRAISEIAKYVAKSGDYLHSYDVFSTYYRAIKNKRITGYSGRCKELRAEYKAGGLRQYVERDLTEYVWLVIYADHYYTGNYTEQTRKPYDALIMGDDDIPVTELLPREWDELAD